MLGPINNPMRIGGYPGLGPSPERAHSEQSQPAPAPAVSAGGDRVILSGSAPAAAVEEAPKLRLSPEELRALVSPQEPAADES